MQLNTPSQRSLSDQQAWGAIQAQSTNKWHKFSGHKHAWCSLKCFGFCCDIERISTTKDKDAKQSSNGAQSSTWVSFLIVVLCFFVQKANECLRATTVKWERLIQNGKGSKYKYKYNYKYKYKENKCKMRLGRRLIQWKGKPGRKIGKLIITALRPNWNASLQIILIFIQSNPTQWKRNSLSGASGQIEMLPILIFDIKSGDLYLPHVINLNVT